MSRPHLRIEPEQPNITCPKCGMTSYHPDDIREGWCGKCRDWTTDKGYGPDNTARQVL